MLVAGCAWPLGATSARGLKTRCVERSAGWRRRVGGCGTRSRVAGRGDIDSVAIAPTGVAFAIETKRARSTHATCTTPGKRPCGYADIGGASAVKERSRCCAWCAPAGSSTSRTRFSWCRSTAWRRRSEPAREPHPAPGSWPRRRLRAERELLSGVASRSVGSGRRSGFQAECRRRRTGSDELAGVRVLLDSAGKAQEPRSLAAQVARGTIRLTLLRSWHEHLAVGVAALQSAARATLRRAAFAISWLAPGPRRSRVPRGAGPSVDSGAVRDVD